MKEYAWDASLRSSFMLMWLHTLGCGCTRDQDQLLLPQRWLFYSSYWRDMKSSCADYTISYGLRCRDRVIAAAPLAPSIFTRCGLYLVLRCRWYISRVLSKDN